MLTDIFHPKYMDYLKSLGTDSVPHSTGTLFDHLVGTAHLLFQWNNPASVCLAGMFHSIYGTKDFKINTLRYTERPHIQQLIGSDAERLVYLFSSCDRRSFYRSLALEGDATIPGANNIPITVPRPVLLQLLEIMVANMLDQATEGDSLQVTKDSSARWLADSLKGSISDSASAALDAFFDGAHFPRLAPSRLMGTGPKVHDDEGTAIIGAAKLPLSGK